MAKDKDIVRYAVENVVTSYDKNYPVNQTFERLVLALTGKSKLKDLRPEDVDGLWIQYERTKSLAIQIGGMYHNFVLANVFNSFEDSAVNFDVNVLTVWYHLAGINGEQLPKAVYRWLYQAA